jgi:hypothetical protein
VSKHKQLEEELVMVFINNLTDFLSILQTKPSSAFYLVGPVNIWFGK